MQKVLPPKYYLDHFRDLVAFLRERSLGLCEPSHLLFLDQFDKLSEDAQCIFVRMLNRKGFYFSEKTLRYAEIENFDPGLAELKTLGFVQTLSADSEVVPALIEFLGKADLSRWLKAAGIDFPKTAGKPALQELAMLNLPKLNLAQLPMAAKICVQGRQPEIEYLLFLYFGKIQRSLSMYTLRDLGIRQVREGQRTYQARFKSLTEARAQYFYAAQLDGWNSLQEDDPEFAVLVDPLQLSGWPKSLNSQTADLREQLLLLVGDYLQGAEKAEDALAFLRECRAHPGQERRVRLLHAMEFLDDAKLELKAMIENPSCDEELLFAEDFFARKYEKKKRGFLSEALSSAREISVSESYLGKPETGVREWYKAQGVESYFTENFLWNALFALNFWDELLVSEKAAIFNPFERAPQDLRGKDFYTRFESAIEERLKLWRSAETGLHHVLQKLAAHYGEPQDLFSWHPGLAPMLTDFIRGSKPEAVAHVLKVMAQNHQDRRTGFPDLMIMTTDGPRFIEVKSEGDAVKPRQLSQMRLLQQAGFPVEILRVKWAPNPDQPYVVVDVETTGGQGPYHRVTEIGAVKVVRGQIIDEFQTLLNPGRSIPPFITKLTGISNDMVKDAPKFADVAESFATFTEGAIFAAHHVRFDYGFIQSEFNRLEMPYVRPLFCTCQNARKYFPKLSSYGLKNLSEHFDIDLKTHHRALCDAKAAAEILLKIQEKRWHGHVSSHVARDEDFNQETGFEDNQSFRTES